MRPTIVEVLPVPADAMIRFWSLEDVAAEYCSSFKRESGKKTPIN